jgi:DNA modification methylase
MKTNTIYTIDALKGLKKLEDKSIDIAFIDPPYNVNKKYGEGVDDNLPPEVFEHLMKDIISEFRRVTKRGFAFYLDWKQYQKFWNWIPDAEPIIIFKRSSGVVYSPLKIVQHHHVILTTAPAIKKQCKRSSKVRRNGGN